MDFFYRDKPWYAGQFVRKVIPKIELTKKSVLFFSALFNKERHKLLSVLVRDVNRIFLNTKVNLPIKNGKINFDFMEDFIEELEVEHVEELRAYLSVTGLENYTLTLEEHAALNKLETTNWTSFTIEDVLVWQMGISELNPLHLDSLSVSEEKKYPFYGQATANNGIIEYRNLNNHMLNNKLSKPTILIHSNNQNTVYLETPFYLKDGHGATSVLQSDHLDKMNAQFIIAAIQKVIFQKFTYNNKATKIALKNTKIRLPMKSNNKPDYGYMYDVISAIQKLIIKDVVIYTNKKLALYNEVVENQL